MEEDLIRRYFNGELSDSERMEIELRQLEDTEFASLMIDFQSTRDGIRLAQKQQLKERLQEIETKKKPKKRMFIAIAASIAIILGAGGVFLFNQNSVDADAIYAEYYEPYPNVYAPITRDGDSMSDLEEAFAQYEQGKYDEALNGFDRELKVNDNQDVFFYKAIVLIQLERTKAAQDVLSTIRLEETDYRPQVLWYESLLFIKNDELKKAKAKLTELDELNAGYKTKTVKELLEKL